MSISGQKITDAEIAACGVQSQPNKLTGSAQQNKQAFDRLIDQVVREKFNALIDELAAATAAGQIGVSVTGLTAANVAAALLEIKTIADQATTGTITPGSVTDEMLADELEIGGKLSGVLPANVGIRCGTAVPTTSDIDEGEIYLKYSEDG